VGDLHRFWPSMDSSVKIDGIGQGDTGRMCMISAHQEILGQNVSRGCEATRRGSELASDIWGSPPERSEVGGPMLLKRQ